MFDTIEVTEVKKAEDTTAATFEEQYAAFMGAVDNHILSLRKDPNLDLADMDTRFSTAVRLQWLQNKTVALVGVGGIGNWVWQALISMGVEKIILIDDDDIEIHNVGPQAHHLINLGVKKVDAAARMIKMYRGVAVKTINARVTGYNNLVSLIGTVPDILITAVDNMEFRNQVAADISTVFQMPNQENRNTASMLPELFIDLRMSLGDWTAYTLPLRSMLAHPRSQALYTHYENTAVFPTSQAVQEPCTARAISYTGMNIASYVGAVLHWYANEGRPYLAGMLDGFSQDPHLNLATFVYTDDREKLQFYMHKTWSSRDWESITPTHAERMLKKRILGLTSEIDTYEAQELALKDQIRLLAMQLEEAQKQKDVAPAKGAKGKATPKAKPSSEPVPAPRPAAPVPAPQVVHRVILHELEPGRRFEVDDLIYETLDVHPTYVSAINIEDMSVERIGLRIMNDAVYVEGHEPGGLATIEDPFRLLPAPAPQEDNEDRLRALLNQTAEEIFSAPAPAPEPRLRRVAAGGGGGGGNNRTDVQR